MSAIRFLFLILILAGSRGECRVVAIGDVHGDYEALIAILRETGILDASLAWSGGETTLVQTGDLLDRGARVREVMDLVMRLEEEAPRRGGRVVQLLGNHEIMNLLLLTRDVDAAVYEDWVTESSDKRRRAVYRSVVRHNRARARELGFDWREPHGFKDNWMSQHPPGYLEYVTDMGPEGTYGAWLRQKDAVALVDGTIFMHAGIPPAMSGSSLEAINEAVRDDLRAADEWHTLLVQYKVGQEHYTAAEMISAARSYLRSERKYGALAGKRRATPQKRNLLEELEQFISFGYGTLLGEEGPMWFRGMATWSEEEGTPYLREILARHDAKRFVCGHTPQSAGIRARFDNQVFLIDTGMLSSFYKGGRASALELDGDRCRAIYLDETLGICVVTPYFAMAPLSPVGPPPQTDAPPLGRRTLLSRSGAPLPLQRDEEILAFLEEAEVMEAKVFGGGSTKPLRMVMERDGTRMRAIFRYVDVTEQGLRRVDGRMRQGFHDRAIHEKAAYELDRLLEMGRVPPVIVRNHDQKDGTIQLWIEQAMTEGMRLEEKKKHPDILFQEHQRRIMLIFDALIYNFDRNHGNSLYGPDWYLWFIDHTRAFRDDPILPEEGKNLFFCERKLWDKIRAVSDEEIREALVPYLRKRQINALLKRRELIVERIEKVIEERGEAVVIYDMKVPR